MADSNEQGLDVELLDKIWKRLDDVYQKMLEIDKLFGKIATRELKFAFSKDLEKIANSLAKMEQSISKFGGSSLSGIKTVVDAINSLAISRRQLNILTDVATTLGSLRTSLGGGGFGAVISNVTAVQFVVKPLLKVMQDLLAMAGTVSIGKMKELQASLREFSVLLLNLRDVIAGMSTIEVSTGIKASAIASLVIVPIFKAIQEIIEFSGKTTVAKLQETQNVIKSMSGLFADLQVAVKDIGGIDFGTAAKAVAIAQFVLIPLFFELNSIIGILSKYSNSGIKSAAAAVESLGGFFRSLSDMMLSIGILLESQGLIRSALAVMFIINPMIDAIRNIIGLLSRLPAKELSNIARIFHGIGDMFVAMRDMLNLVAGQSLIASIMTAIKAFIVMIPFVSTIRKVVEIASTVKGSQLTGMGEFFRGLGIAFTGYADLMRQIKSLGIIGSIINTLIAQLVVLPPLINIVKKVAQATAGVQPGQLSGLGEVFSGLGSVLRPLAVFSRDVARVNDFGDLVRVFFSLKVTLGAFGGLVKTIIDASKSIKDASTIENLGKLIGEVGNLLEKFGLLASLKELDKSNIKAFKEFVEVIPNTLNKLKFDDKAAKSLGTFLEILNKSIGGGESGDVGIVRDLAAALVDLSKADFSNFGDTRNVEALFKAIVDAFSKINIKDFKDFIETASLLRKLEGIGQGEQKFTNEILEQNSAISANNALEEQRIRKFNLLGNVLSTVGQIALAAYQNLTPFSLIRRGIAAIGELGDALKEIGDQIRDAGQNMTDFGTDVIDRFGIQNIFSSDAFQSTVEFDKVGTLLEVFGGLTKEARLEAEAFANQIGKDYPLSANDALNATLDLIKAGQDLTSVQQILPNAANLAALSDTGDLDLITKTLITAEGQFERFDQATEGTFTNITRFSDLISAAADVSTASIESLSEGLGNAGTAANAFGLTAEETLATLAIFEDAGIKGAEGGTALTSLLNALGSEKTQRTLAGLNVSLFDTETGARKPLNEIINDISVALEDMPEAERANALQNLADTFGRQGLNVLLGQGEDAIANMILEMNGIAPASERAAATLDNFAGDVLQLQGSVETLMTAALQPLLEDVFRPFVKLGRFVIDTLLGLDREVLRFIATSVTLLSIGATLVGGFAIFLGVLLQVGGAVFIVVGTMLNLVNVFVILVGGTAAVVAGFLALVAIFAVVIPVMTAITSAFLTLTDIFRNDIGGARTQLESFAATVSNYVGILVSLGAAIFNLLGITGDASGAQGIIQVGEAIASFFFNLTDGLDQFEGLFGDLKKFGEAFNGIVSLFNVQKQIEAIDSDIGELSGLAGLEGVVAGLEDQRRALNGQFYEIFQDLFGNNEIFRDILRRFGSDFGGTRAAFDNLINNLGQVGTSFSNVFTVIGQGITDGLNALFSGQDVSAVLDTFIANLDNAIGDAAGSVLLLFSRLFGFDATELIETAQNEGFGALAGTLISTLLDSIKNGIIQNRGFLKTTLNSILSLFFAPLDIAKFFAGLFGAQGIVDFLDGFENAVRGALGGVFDTIVNLLQGQSLEDALTNAFGEDVQPFINLMLELGEALGYAFDIIGDVFSAFVGMNTGGAAASIGTFFESVVNMFTRYLRIFNDFFLAPLANGDFLTASTNGISFITNIVRTFADAIATQAAGIDPTLFLTVGTAIVNAVLTAISTAFTNLSTLTGIDFSAVSTTLATTINANLEAANSGETGGLFAVVGNTIVGFVAAAIQTAFAALGDVLNIDTTAAQQAVTDALGPALDEIEAIFLGNGEREDIFTNITTTITNISTALTSLGDAIGGLGGDSSGATTLLTDIGSFFSGLAGLPLSLLLLPLRALDGFFVTLAAADTGTLIGVGTALLTIGGAILLISNAASITTILLPLGIFISSLAAGQVALLPLIGTGMTAISTAFTTFANSLIGKFAGFLAILLIIQSLVQSADEFVEIFDSILEGDIGGALIDAIDALVDFFANIAFNLFDLLGIGDMIGTTREEFMTMIRGVGNLFLEVLRLGFIRLIDLIVINLKNAFVFIVDQLRQIEIPGIGPLISDEVYENLVGGFQRAKTALETEGLIDFGAVFSSGASLSDITSLARLNAQNYIDSFTAALLAAPDPTTILLTDANLQQALRLAVDAGIGQDLIAQIIASIGVDAATAQIPLILAPTLTVDNFGDFEAQIDNLVASGVLTQDAAVEMFTTLAINSTDPAVIAEANRAAEEQRTTVETEMNADNAENPVQTTVEAEAEVNTTVTNPENTAEEVQTSIQDITTTPVTVDVNVDPVVTNGEEAAQDVADQTETALGDGVELDVSTLQTAEEVAAYSAEIATLTSQVGLLATEISTFPERTAAGKLALDGILTTLTDIGLKAAMANTQFVLLSPILLLFGVSATAGFTLATTAATTFFNFILNRIQTTIQGLINTQVAITQVAIAITKATAAMLAFDAAAKSAAENAAAAQAAGGGGGGGGGEGNESTTDGNANGGKTMRGGRYRIDEQGSEVLLENGNMYLLASGAGKIEPLRNALPQFGSGGVSNVPVAGATSNVNSTSNVSNVTVAPANVIINIDGTSGDPTAIAAATAQAVAAENEKNNRTVREQLRTNFR